MISDTEAVSKMETEADDCRRLAAKFKRKAECARLSAKRAFFSGLERRYLLLAQVFEKEAEKLRATKSAINNPPSALAWHLDEELPE
jgi:hypothetical protein